MTIFALVCGSVLRVSGAVLLVIGLVTRDQLQIIAGAAFLITSAIDDNTKGRPK